MATTRRTRYFVRDSGPQSLVTWTEVTVSSYTFTDSIETPEKERREKYLGMCFNNSHPPRPVWLLRICPEEIMFLNLERRGGLSICGAA